VNTSARCCREIDSAPGPSSSRPSSMGHPCVSRTCNITSGLDDEGGVGGYSEAARAVAEAAACSDAVAVPAAAPDGRSGGGLSGSGTRSRLKVSCRRPGSDAKVGVGGHVITWVRFTVYTLQSLQSTYVILRSDSCSTRMARRPQGRWEEEVHSAVDNCLV